MSVFLVEGSGEHVSVNEEHEVIAGAGRAQEEEEEEEERAPAHAYSVHYEFIRSRM
jgi:hypothetical protein